MVIGIAYAITLFSVVMLFIYGLLLERGSYKKGYEEATRDFYYGKLKCELNVEKDIIVWKE